MASQEHLFGRSLLCQPVVKFSHSILPRHATPSGWSHVQAPNLFALIEETDQDAGIQLRVVQGTNDLEILPLTAIIQETNELLHRNPAETPNNLPISGLTKGTALAIRYFCQDNQVRRIQLRFENDDSCLGAVQLLSRHGLNFSMPTNKQTTQSSARPSTANSYMDRRPSVQSARFDRESSSIVVPSAQDTFGSQGNYVDLHRFTSSPSPHNNPEQTRNIQRQPTFAPIRTSEELSRRPSTAPIEWPSDMTRKLLPPRRELPFPKPSSSSSKTKKMLPPLPKPSYASEATKPEEVRENKEEQSRAGTENQSPARQRVMRLETPKGPTRFEPPTSRTFNFQSRDSGISDTASVTMSPAACPSVARPTSEYCPSSDGIFWSPERARPQEAAQSLFSSPGSMMASDPPQPMVSSPGSMLVSDTPQPVISSPVRMPSPLRASNTEVQDVEMTAPSPEENAQENLRRYAQQSDEVRKAALDKFYVDNLFNEDFIRLVEDMDSCWQRFVLDRRG